MQDNKNGISRRSFLAGTGAALSGLAAGSVIGYSTSASAAATSAGDFPWPAAGLDVQEVRKKAFDAYFNNGGCCVGAAKGLLDQVRAQFTSGADADSAKLAQWDVFPDNMFLFGAGGAMSWGTLCGALNGALFVLNAVLKKDAGNMSKAADFLMDWYSDTSLPLTDNTNYLLGLGDEATDSLSDHIANDSTAKVKVNGVLQTYAWNNYPKKLNTAGTAVDEWINLTGTNTTVLANQTTCYTPLCHVSVSTFCDRPSLPTSPFTVAGWEKKVRCARLTADVAGMTAAIINKIKNVSTANLQVGATYVAKWVYSDTTADCIDCHWGGVQSGTAADGKTKLYEEQSVNSGFTARKDDEQGKMQCEVCHEPGTKDKENIATNPFLAKTNKAPDCVRTEAGISRNWGN